MSQVATLRKLDVRNERIVVEGRFHESGSVLRGDAAGFCDGFVVTIELDSDEDAEALAELFRLAHQKCFTAAALAQPVPIEVRHIVNGSPLG